jgi:anaerobic selenocysteine-containing dehydrogenase
MGSVRELDDSVVERHSFCRICNKGCPLIVEIRDGKLTRVRGDKANPLYTGYTCLKGRAMPTFINDPNRLLRSRVRTALGWRDIPVEQAMDEIASRLSAIIAEHGPRSVATYYGTQLQNVPANPIMRAFMAALGSPMFFGASTLDKPGRPIAWTMLGRWMAPHVGFDRPRVALLLGINPLVNGLGGLPAGHPATWLTERLADGMELIVIDPRRTDTAKRATLFLQPRPGHDVEILAAMLRVVLTERRYDVEFVNENVRNLASLKEAVAPFTPARVAAEAGLEEGDIVKAARIFAGAGRGYATAGTGPHMAGSGTLLEYLALCLDTVCGHWQQAGETVRTAGVLAAPRTAVAQAMDPKPAYGFGERSRVRGLGMTAAGMPSATLAEEILLEGPGRVRALISCGGNPVAAMPDERQTVEALQSLDLLVQVDPWMAATAKLADFVIAPKMSPEMIGTTLKIETSSSGYATGYAFADDYAQYSAPVVDPPAGSEVIEDWELFYGLAQRLGLQLRLTGQDGTKFDLDMRERPDAEALVELLSTGSRVPLSEVKSQPGGAFFPATPPVVVQPKEPGWSGRLDVGNPDMLIELANRARREQVRPAGFPFRLLCRRLPHAVNSSYNARAAAGHESGNAAFVHPDDLAELALAPGDLVEIESAHAAVTAVVDGDPALRRGTVSMSFGFGSPQGEDHLVRKLGASAARLLSTCEDPDPFSGQPTMSSVPVAIRKRPER